MPRVKAALLSELPEGGALAVEAGGVRIALAAVDVEVYAFATGMERRLGTVEPGMKASFVVPPNLTTSGDVELQVSPAASSQRFRSGSLLLAPGSIVDLIVAPQLFSSTATIRP